MGGGSYDKGDRVWGYIRGTPLLDNAHRASVSKIAGFNSGVDRASDNVGASSNQGPTPIKPKQTLNPKR